MKRRHLLGAACATGLTCLHRSGTAQEANSAAYVVPPRLARPDLSSDEGGLWAMMDREETRLRRSPFVLRDAPLRDYLQAMVCKLAGDHCADVRVYPVRTPFFNASMAPNGMMQVWTGLLLRVENEAQLAAVLGHEIGHYVQRHLLDRLRDAKSRSAFGLFLGMFGVVGLVGQLGMIAGAFGFSRDQERDADRIGLALMRRAGYDPREAAKVWDNLRAEMAANPGSDPSTRSPMFASHPPSDERSQTLSRLAADASGGFVGEAEFNARMAPFQFDLLEDEVKRGQYAESRALLDRLIARWPKRADLLYFRGETHRLRGNPGDLDEALVDYRAAMALGDEPVQTYRAEGYVLQKLDHPAEARAAFGRYLERAPEAPDAALLRAYVSESKS